MSLSAKEIKELISGVLKKQTLAVSRVISLIENHHPDSFKILSKLYPRTGSIYKIGMTGFPGAGKSTLINKLAKFFLDKKKRVGVILVDPTSPVTGGALLGDRIRMKDIQTEPNVFIRSMASRGGHGGLAQTSRYAVDVLDAAGYDIVIVETVGVGQLEIDIAHAAHRTMVVLTPESGDEVQAMKAGLMEVSHFFVVNKMDRDKDKLWLKRLQSSIEVATHEEGRVKPQIFPVSALYSEGLEHLFVSVWDAYQKHSRHAAEPPAANGLDREIVAALEQLFVSEVAHSEDLKKKIGKYREDLLKRRKSPYEIAHSLMKGYLK